VTHKPLLASDVALLAQGPVLPAKGGELLALGPREPGALAGIDPSLGDPTADFTGFGHPVSREMDSPFRR